MIVHIHTTTKGHDAISHTGEMQDCQPIKTTMATTTILQSHCVSQPPPLTIGECRQSKVLLPAWPI